ncbi:MAG TPA: hypothetical protein VFM12_07370, partial [Gemmatimonadales bacterium]|nr:hypothetical protein [Gemmatimonadales bacterium]
MSDWAETRRVAASVIVAGGDVIIGELHLQPSVPYRDGPESPLELLNRGDCFFPLALADGGVTFLSKETVSVVSCATADMPAPDPARLGAISHVELEVRLAGGDYRGRADIEMPPTRARALDYLNTSGRFFALVTGTTIRFLNRSHV